MASSFGDSNLRAGLVDVMGHIENEDLFVL